MFHKSHITYFSSIISNLKTMQGCFTTTVILRYFPKREYTHGYSGLLYGHFMNKVNKRNPTILWFPNFNKLPVPVIGVIVPVFINLLVFTCFFVHLSYVLLYAIRQFFILALQNELHCSKKSPAPNQCPTAKAAAYTDWKQGFREDV